jgi:hypothetical protein
MESVLMTHHETPNESASGWLIGIIRPNQRVVRTVLVHLALTKTIPSHPLSSSSIANKETRATMKQTLITVTMLALSSSNSQVSAFAFQSTPPTTTTSLKRTRTTSSSPLYSSMTMSENEALPFFLESTSVVPTVEQQPKPASPPSTTPNATTKKAPLKKSNTDQLHKNNGVLSPVVLLAKQALGEDKLNKVRAKAISLHSDVIAAFVDTSNTAIGQTVLKALFSAADANRNGVIEETELARMFETLGFEWLKDKQVKGILQRADSDSNGVIDMTEFMQEAPKTLRTNLIKLAKKNGGELGLLA